VILPDFDFRRLADRSWTHVAGPTLPNAPTSYSPSNRRAPYRNPPGRPNAATSLGSGDTGGTAQSGAESPTQAHVARRVRPRVHDARTAVATGRRSQERLDQGPMRECSCCTAPFTPHSGYPLGRSRCWGVVAREGARAIPMLAAIRVSGHTGPTAAAVRSQASWCSHPVAACFRASGRQRPLRGTGAAAPAHDHVHQQGGGRLRPRGLASGAAPAHPLAFTTAVHVHWRTTMTSAAATTTASLHRQPERPWNSSRRSPLPQSDGAAEPAGARRVGGLTRRLRRR